MQLSAIEYAEKKIKNALEQGVQQGIEKGLQQGIEKGGFEKAVKMAKSMLKKNYAIEKIAELTDLSVELIEQISQEND